MSVQIADWHFSWISALAILIASISGSIHCVGMCGGLMLSATRASLTAQVAYHLGRGLSYTLLGALAGGIGDQLLVRLSIEPLQLLFTALLSVMLVWAGIQVLWTGEVGFVSALTRTFGFQRLFEKVWRNHSTASVQVRSGLIGLMTVFLPCGWLYSFILIATATRSAALGALIMAIFWLGSVPLLASARILLQAVLAATTRGQHRRLSQKAVALGMILLGLFSVYEHAKRFSEGSAVVGPVNCHLEKSS